MDNSEEEVVQYIDSIIELSHYEVRYIDRATSGYSPIIFGDSIPDSLMKAGSYYEAD